MKIVKKTHSELCMKTGIIWGLVVWSLGFGGIPLFMIIALISDIGITEISCKRFVPTQVDCIKTQSRYFGLVESSSQTIPRVVEARFIQKIEKGDCDCDDSHIDNSVALVTKHGWMVTAAAEDAYRNGVKGNEVIMRKIANQLNDFFKSDEISVSVIWDNRFTGFNLTFLAFTGIFIVIAIITSCFALRIKTLRISKVDGVLEWRQLSFLGFKKRVFKINEITAVEMKTKIDGDCYLEFSPAIVLNSGEPFILDTAKQQKMMLTILNDIGSFLGIPIICDEGFNRHQQVPQIG